MIIFDSTNNFFKLKEKYKLSDYDSNYIKNNFWPIVVVNSHDLDLFKKHLLLKKKTFIEENNVFDLDIFKREELEGFIKIVTEFLDIFIKKKYLIWDEYNGDYFYKCLPRDRDFKLIISDKKDINLEIYLKSILSEISLFIENETQILTQNDSKIVLDKSELTNKQKALISVYNNEPVTRPINGNDIYNLWLKVNNPKDRLADPESKLKYKHKVKLFESVIEILLEPNKQKATDDLNTFKSKYEKDYL